MEKNIESNFTEIEEKKVYIVNSDIQTRKWISKIPFLKSTINLEESDIVLFTGGEDVSPTLYNQKLHPYSNCKLQRDIYEHEIFKKSKDKLKLGICRGGQFLCVMSNGQLIQHISHSSEKNNIHTIENNFLVENYTDKIKVNSYHHQMMYPFFMNEKDYNLIAFTKDVVIDNISLSLLDNPNNIKVEKNICPEIVLFNNTNSLCIQSHPEYSNFENQNYILNLIYNWSFNNNQYIDFKDIIDKNQKLTYYSIYHDIPNHIYEKELKNILDEEEVVNEEDILNK